MTNETTQTREATAARKPGFVAKTRQGHGKGAVYERIGVAWQNDDGSFYVKLHGTQVVSEFSLYKLEPADTQTA